MRNLKNIFMIFLALILLMGTCGNVLWAEGEQAAAGNEQLTADNMNFDVIFAIDGSGSMKKSDTLKLRLTAGRLFTELAASDTSRAGYVQFTNVLMESSGLTELSSEESKKTFRNKLAVLKDSVEGTWDTDISLGLTEALRLLKEGGSFGNDRNPVIILLSDGNTDLPAGPRTVEESNAELTSTLSEMAGLGVPVYSIGLNWDGKLDIDYMQNIAGKTGGEFYNITTASDFNQYMTQIFGNVADGEASPLNPKYVNGRYETNFVIDNSSVLTANIVILTDKGVSDPQLTDSNGNNVPLDKEHGIIVSTDVSDGNHPSTYTILKIMYPEQGAWKVSVKGEADDAISVNLLTTYDISFVISSGEGLIAGQEVTLTGRLIRADEEIKDSDLLEGATAYCTIVDNKGNIVGENLPMTYDAEDMVFTYTTNLEKSGNYYVTANLKGREESFSKQSSQYQLSLERMPIKVSGDVNCSMWCSPIKTTVDFNLENNVSCESLSEINCTLDSPEESIVAVDYKRETGVVTLTPLTTGEQNVVMVISDEYGQSGKLNVNVTVKPSWLWFAVGAVVLIILLAMLLILRNRLKPVLKEPVTVELSLPPMLMNLTPAPVTLSMPSKKSEAMLGKLIQSDQMAQSTFSEPIIRANLAVFLEKIKLKAAKGGEVSVKILPKVQGIVLVNNQNIDTAKGAVFPLRKGDKLGLQFSFDGTNSSIVYLKLGQDAGTWETDQMFGGSTGGFGEESFGSPFGGQGGFDSAFSGQSGFGNPFSGSQGDFGNPFAGAQSGFGGGNSSGFGVGGTGGPDDFDGDNGMPGSNNQEDLGNFESSYNSNSGLDSSDHHKNNQSNSGFNFGENGLNSQNGSEDGFGGFF